MRALLVALLLLPAPAFAADGPNTTLIGGLVLLVVACAVVLALHRAWGLAATSIAGVLVSAYIAREHITLKHGGASTCGVSDVVDCSSVLTSRWSEIAGTPVVLLGLGFYAAMAWLTVRMARGGAPTAGPLVLLGGVLGLGFDAFLGFQMWTLGKLCVLCLTTYGLNLLLLVGGVLEGRGRSLGEAVRAEAGGGAVAGLVTLVVSVMWYQGAAQGGPVTPVPLDPAAAVAAAPERYYERTTGPVEIDPGDAGFGNPNAKYTIVEWADLECGHCAHMYETLHDWLPANPDVRLIYKHFPISNKCNRAVERDAHPAACGAAVAADCAAEQGKFWELAGKMFANQQYLSPDDVVFMANELGLDVPRLQACMAQPERMLAVVADADAGARAGVMGTPSLYVRGIVGDGWVRMNAMEKAELDTLFAAARSGKALPPAPPPQPEG